MKRSHRNKNKHTRKKSDATFHHNNNTSNINNFTLPNSDETLLNKNFRISENGNITITPVDWDYLEKNAETNYKSSLLSIEERADRNESIITNLLARTIMAQSEIDKFLCEDNIISHNFPTNLFNFIKKKEFNLIEKQKEIILITNEIIIQLKNKL